MEKKEETYTRSDVDARSLEYDEGSRIGRGSLGEKREIENNSEGKSIQCMGRY